MAGGYRCSHGHAWNSAPGVKVVACPVCGDTALVAADDTPAVVVLAAGGAPAGGQDATQPLPPPEVPVAAPDHAPTVAFAAHQPPTSADTPDPSFSSLVVLLPESGEPPAGAAASSVVPFGAAETSDYVPPLVPGYEIQHEVGRGGMGVVYKARQLNLNRPVALKMILSGSHAGPAERERFKREAEAVAALQHPHIVQIFEIGEANGHAYLALEFVEGGSLAHHLTGGPWDAGRAAELVEVLARTMQFAHDAGIVHRDLKPGNILLSSAERGARNAEFRTEEEPSVFHSALRAPHSALVPKVTDFGLAKRLDETLGDGGTRTGAVMGTPSYIAPEQAAGKARDIGPPTDAYALGAILYELLTGRPPFRGETPLDTVLQVLHDDPVAPKRLNPRVPRDLETICLKCLAKPPAKRYASAAALADDLRRFLNGEPIRARPLSAWGRTAKWARRHPALAALLVVTGAAAVALVTVLSIAYLRVREAVGEKEHEKQLVQQERDRVRTERERAEKLAAENEARRAEAVQRAEELKREAERTRRAAYALQLAQVAILCERDPRHAAELLDDEARCPPDLRDFTWHYLRRLCRREDREYPDHGPDDPLRAAAYSPNGAFVATAGDAGPVRLWDPRTGRTWLVLEGHAGAVHGIAFSPDGTVLASAGADGTVRLWVLPVQVLDTARRAVSALPWLQPLVAPLVAPPVIAPALTLDAHAGEASCVAFAPDSRALVSGGADGLLRWWDLTAWRPAPPDAAALGGPGAVAAALARANRSPDARPVWVARAVPAHPGGVLAVSFSQDGRFLASGGKDSRARVWSGDGSKAVRALPPHAGPVRAVAVAPGGATVATANNGAPPTVRLFDTQTWRERRLFGHTKSVYALAFSDDGQVIASAGFDKTVRLWDAEDGRERGRLVGHAQQVNALAFAPGRRNIVSAGMDGVAVVWQTSARTHEADDLMRFARDPLGKNAPQGLTAAAVGGGGTAVVAADDAGHVRLFAIDYAPPGRKPPPGPPGPLALTQLPYPQPGQKVAARAAAAGPDGRTFVVAVEGGLLVWRPFGPAARLKAPGLPPRGAFTRPVLVKTTAPVHAMSIDPTGRWLATVDPGAVRLYDLRAIPTGTDRPEGVRSVVVLAVAGAREAAFHPARDWLAVSVGNGVRVVSRAGKVLADVPDAHGPRANIDALAFDRAGSLLATGDASGLVKLWSLDAAGRLAFQRDLRGHTGPVYALAFSPNGRTLASGGEDRAVFLWDPLAGRERLALSGHADRVTDLAFSADGTALVTLSRDGAVKRWRADK